MNRLAASFWVALSTYSKIPVPQVPFDEENRRYSLCFFPCVGIFTGALMLLWLHLCDVLALGMLLRGAVACVLPIAVSGGIHMDGFMDTMDAIGSWRTREERLNILKDSHTGAFAVIGCTGLMLVSAALWSEVRFGRGAMVLCVCFVLSRAVSALALMRLPSARPGGMADGFRRAAPPRAVRRALYAAALACALAMLLLDGLSSLFALCAGALVLALYARMARNTFGGATGDLAGFFLQCFELACAAAVVLSARLGA